MKKKFDSKFWRDEMCWKKNLHDNFVWVNKTGGLVTFEYILQIIFLFTELLYASSWNDQKGEK